MLRDSIRLPGYCSVTRGTVEMHDHFVWRFPQQKERGQATESGDS